MNTDKEIIDIVEKVVDAQVDIREKIQYLEQTSADQAYPNGTKSYGSQSFAKAIADAPAFKAFQDGTGNSCRFSVKAAIINATGGSQPLVQGDRLNNIVHTANRRLSIRDLLPQATTDSNVVEFAKENVYTNSAGPQVGGSPEAMENVTKPESGITHTLETAAVTTLAHWIPVSKQVLSDSQLLQTYLRNRLVYGLKLKEDQQLLLGTGSNGELSGLYTNRTAYTITSPLSYTTKLDVLRDAMAQVEANDYMCDGVILNSADWKEIQLAKVGTSDLRYVLGDPAMGNQPSIWGVPVVVSNTMASGTFLVGSFQNAAQIFDREEATIEIGLNSDNFVKNMVTILCEERLTLAVYNSTAMVGGSFAVA